MGVEITANKIAEAAITGARIGKERHVGRERREEGEEKPETIRVSSGGDGPKVEIASRRAGASRPAPEASVSPDEGREGDQ